MTKISAVLLVVGLVVGIGLGYGIGFISYQSKIDSLETQVTDLASTIMNYETDISSLESQISDLQSQLITKSGHAKFSAYGFSFEYPKVMYLSFDGVLESEVNEYSGLVMGKKLDETEMLVVLWVGATYPRNLDVALEDGFGTTTGITRGQRVTSTINGHEIKYQDYTITHDDSTYNGVMAAWNCDINRMVYSISYLNAGEDALFPFLQYLDSFVCH
jgi:outer membrane murein-binding lipoprotein Lpp